MLNKSRTQVDHCLIRLINQMQQDAWSFEYKQQQQMVYFILLIQINREVQLLTAKQETK